MRPDSYAHGTTDRIERRPTLIAMASVAAGVIHAAVVPEHLGEWWPFGAFFVIAAGFQVGWAIMVVSRPSAAVDVSGIVGNGAMIGLWGISRTLGLPIGPDVWTPEPVGMLDLVATVLEIFIVIGLAARRMNTREVPPGRIELPHMV